MGRQEITFLFFFLTCLTNTVFAQDSLFFQQNFIAQHLGVEDGLSQGSVYCKYRDSRDFMWFSSFEGLNRYDGHSFKIYRNNPKDSTSIRGYNITGIVEDKHGNIWIGTEECLNIYNRKTDKFSFLYAQDENGNPVVGQHFPFAVEDSLLWYVNETEGLIQYNYVDSTKTILSDAFSYQSTYHQINMAIRSRDGSIWMRLDTGIAQIESRGNIRYFFTPKADNIAGEPTFIYCVFEDADGIIWLGTEKGIIRLNSKKSNYQKINEVNQIEVDDIAEYPKGYLWLATTDKGIFIFDKTKKQIVRHFNADNKGNDALFNNSSGNIYIDKHGICWVGTDPAGVDFIQPAPNSFTAFSTDYFNKYGLSMPSTCSFTERSDGKIWVGTERAGLFLFNPESDVIEQVVNEQSHPTFVRSHGRCLEIDAMDNLWVGSYSILGLSHFDKNDNWVQHPNQLFPEHQNSSNFYWDILTLAKNQFVFATDYGVYYSNPLDFELKALDTLQHIHTGVLYQDEDFLLIPEQNNGFYALRWKNWLQEQPIKTPIQHFFPDYSIKSFLKKPDSDSLWLATTTGLLLAKVHPNWEKVELLKFYGPEDGIPSSCVYAVLDNSQGNIWLSTNRGVSHFNPKTERFTNFEPADGISGYEFNTNSFYKTRDDNIYFGGVDGFTRISTTGFTSNKKTPPKVQITAMQVNNRPFETAQYIGETQKIELSHLQRNFDFTLAARDYSSFGTNEFKVQLEGFDDDWEKVGNNNNVRYTNIPPGNYTFKALSANNDGLWGTDICTLQIVIRPPWWATYWAYGFYLLTILSLAYAFYSNRLRQQLAKQEALRLQEIDTLKTRFFTNITHEFRTPLTIILGQARELQEKISKEHFSKAQDIEYNGKTLLNLVNQLLELAQIEAGKEQINYIQTDIIPFLHYLTDSFRSLAFSQKINLSFYSAEEALIMDFDKEKIQRIVTNLISNSLKFTPEYGKIQVQASISKIQNKPHFLLKIQDSGVGIASTELPFIFERFYQGGIDNNRGIKGSGVGLTLVKELAELLDGTIEVESVLHSKTTFTLRLPIKNKAPKSNPEWSANSIASQKATTSILPNETIKSDKTSILIIEDNIDVARYIQSVLVNDYQVFTARNGQEGVQVALEQIPDIILCDVMMPLMDGFEVCQQLKQEIRSSHIPIILLTAKASQKDRIEGINLGADAYLSKPFDKKELFAQIKNLLQNRQRLQVHYNQARPLQNTNIPSKAPDLETQFLERIYTIVHQQLDNEAFTGDWLAKEMKMSKSQIYRKLNALTGKSIAVYIRSIRLQEARQLLQTTTLSVQEIAYQCGFSSPAYFSRTFKKEFGRSPNELKT